MPRVAPCSRRLRSKAGREQDIVDVADIDLTSPLQTAEATDGDAKPGWRIDRIEDGKTLVVGQSLHNVNDTRDHLLIVLILGSLAAIGAALSLSWWLVRAGLRPLRPASRPVRRPSPTMHSANSGSPGPTRRPRSAVSQPH